LENKSKKRSLSKSNKKIVLSWDTYISMVYNLCDKIKKSKIKFKYVYGPPRGGYIPSVIISHELKKDLVINIEDCREGPILIVDDIIDTSKTINELLLHHVDDSIKVYTASIFKHKKSPFNPDFFIQKNDKWVKFPYERN
jgi:hypoxanthine phosphoribosyltransferase